jgi:hypothetical protein
MKAEEVKNLIICILQEKPRFFDHVNTKEVKALLLEHYNISVSERMVIKVMMQVVEEGKTKFGDYGYVCGDGSTLTWADEHEVAGSKMTGVHKY